MTHHFKHFRFVVAASLLIVSTDAAYSQQNLANVQRVTQSPLALPTTKTGYELALSSGQIKATGRAKLSYKNAGLNLRFDDPFHDSGLEIKPAGEGQTWDFNNFKQLAVDVENLSGNMQMRLLMEISIKDTPRKVNVGIGLNPGEKRTMRLLLPHQWKYGHPEGVAGVRTIDATEITKINFFMQWPFEKVKKNLVNCRITNLRAEEPVLPTAPLAADKYIPFIDQYGQFVHGNWPEKIHSAADLKKQHERELKQLASSERPREWNKYGSWKNGPRLKATGHFRTEKYKGKWWMVDPEGYLFISQGMDVINHGTESLKVLEGKENWFQSLPEGAKSYTVSKVTLPQKYGTEDFVPQYMQTASKRLEAWGFNTIGNWSSLDLIALGKTPYTLQLTDYDYKMPRIGGSKLKFYDVFDPAYINKMKNLIPDLVAKNPVVAKSLTDPMCIGYFIDNELNFGNRGRMTLVDDIMKSPPKQAAKLEFVKDLKQKYNSIEALNAAWKTTYANWDVIPTSTDVPQSKGYRDDAQVFFLKNVDQYFRLAQESIKSVAPHRLYLGARFISTDAVRPALYEASKKYSDILTVNVYAHSVANYPSHYEGLPDMPVLIGEFQFGLLQRGMFSASLCQAGATPEDRGHAYTRFMQGALVHPNIVGAHYFQFRDQPLTGRGDGEAYQIGFVDVTDTPYPEMTEASRLIGENMYRYRMNGKLVSKMK
jgi:hypothetical protein